MFHYRIAVLCLLAVTLFSDVLTAWDDEPDQQQGKESLIALQEFVGQWKGAGQIRRGSTQGAWIEESQWVWQFDEAGAAVILESKKGKFLVRLELRAAKKTDEFVATGETPDGKKVHFSGKVNEDGRLVLVATEPEKQLVARISIRTVAEGKRMVATYERLLTGTLYGRLGELGSTRKGSMFGAGGTQIVCIVSGGKGTTPVTYDGKTYYVCCSGCRDYFNENAAEVVAEYLANKK